MGRGPHTWKYTVELAERERDKLIFSTIPAASIRAALTSLSDARLLLIKQAVSLELKERNANKSTLVLLGLAEPSKKR